MRIHPRHFNRFMVIVAIVGGILIVIATLYRTSNREAAFQKQMMQADSLEYATFPYVGKNDSLRLNQFRGQFLLLDFWSTWSEPSLDSQKELAGRRRNLLNVLTVVAASVRTDSSKIMDYRRTNGYPFEFVDGTEFFDRWNIPGVPSQVLIDPNGEVIAAFVGYTGPARYDSLQTLIPHE